ASAFTGGSNAVVTDQIKVLKSRRLVSKVVQKQNLQISYAASSSLKSRKVLPQEVPFTIQCTPEQLTSPLFKGEIVVNSIDHKTFKITESDIIEEKVYRWGEHIPTPFGPIVFHYTNANPDLSINIKVKLTPLDDKVTEMVRRINITPDADKKSMAIKLSLIGPNIDLAKALIDEFIR